MLFNSFQFLWLFPLVFVLYYSVIKFMSKGFDKSLLIRFSNVLLLLISYALYLQWNPYFTIVLLWITIVTYLGAICLERLEHKKKVLIWVLAAGALAPLFIFKYYNFLLGFFSDILASVGCTVGIPGVNWAIPLGISFYSFQAVGYLFDVYHQRIKAERDLLDYMLFVSFFPQLASGPISRSQDLLPQIKSNRVFDAYKATIGLRWLLWGMFLKVVVADRLGVYVDKVYDSYMYQSGISCAFAAFMYSFQIYADFAGYSLMAIGVGRLMGFDLINNFNRPYCASSITEFWKRWHISLTRWLTTHVYIALGGNRCSTTRQYWNIMATFLVSGLWHGANWTFVVWGAIHGVLQILEKFFGLDPKGHLSQSTWLKSLKPLRILITFVLVTIAWVFFRMPSIDTALDFFNHMFSNHQLVLFSPAPDTMLLVFAALLCIVLKDWIEELYPNVKLMGNKSVIVRWLSYIVLVVWILLGGVFDASNFIYANF